MARPGRHEEGARTRQRVIEAAADLIARRGYAGSSIAQISQASGANPASIYWAFGNKEGLFAAVMERAAASFFEEVTRTLKADDPWEGIAQLADAFEAGPEFLRLLLVLSLERRDGDPAVLDAARRVRSEAAARLAAAFATALDLDDEVVRTQISESLARHTLMLFDGVFVASQIEPEATDLKRSFALIALGVRATAEELVREASDARRGAQRWDE
jgi:AcrR family transcriptional regulator